MAARVAAIVALLVAPLARATLPPFEALKTLSQLGSVPFVSLPEAMGPLDGWGGIEWWYFSGAVIAADGATLSLQFELYRDHLGREIGVNVAGSVLGVGIPGVGGAAPRYAYAATPGLWSGDAATWETMDVRARPGLRARLVDGYAGVAGATYALEGDALKGAVRTPDGASANVTMAANLTLTDSLGAVLEGFNALVPFSVGSTYEFAVPSLSVEGGTLRVGAETIDIVGGHLWLDRQGLPKKNATAAARRRGHRAPPAVGKEELYVGNWIAILLPGARFELGVQWSVHDDQWISGAGTRHPPRTGFGVAYDLNASYLNVVDLDRPLSVLGRPMDYAPPCDAPATNQTELARCWWRGGPAGGSYSVALRNPSDPAASPHWTSPFSNATYATAWDVVLRPPLTNALDGPLRGADVTIAIDALVPHAENRLGKADCFWEGAAAVTIVSPAAAAGPAGFAFVEQMGYEAS